jgi:hypothetical protein
MPLQEDSCTVLAERHLLDILTYYAPGCGDLFGLGVAGAGWCWRGNCSGGGLGATVVLAGCDLLPTEMDGREGNASGRLRSGEGGA